MINVHVLDRSSIGTKPGITYDEYPHGCPFSRLPVDVLKVIGSVPSGGYVARGPVRTFCMSMEGRRVALCALRSQVNANGCLAIIHTLTLGRLGATIF